MAIFFQTSLRVPSARPVSSYLRWRYSATRGGTKRFVMWLNDRARCQPCHLFWKFVTFVLPADYPLKIVRTDKYLEYSEIVDDFRAMVALPHGNVMQMMFYEASNMGLPVLLPDLRLMDRHAMGGLLPKPVTKKETEDGAGAKGCFSFGGPTDEEQDAHMAIPDFDPERELGLFGVFDGHGGSAVAKVAAATFPNMLSSQKSFSQGRYSEALYEDLGALIVQRQAFLALDEFLDSPAGRAKVDEAIEATAPPERDAAEEERIEPFKEDDKLKQDLLSGSWEALGEPTRSFRERHGFPATLAWALLQLNFPSFPSRRVDLWVLGARTGMEGWLAEDGKWRMGIQSQSEGLWDFLAKVFPRLEWRIRLIGPEMQDGVYRSTLVEVEGPDLVVCFNSGIGTLSLSITKPWLPTVAALLKLDAPVLFTSFGAKEWMCSPL
eukprot:g20798.t1